MATERVGAGEHVGPGTDAEPEPRLPTNWRVKAIDMTAAQLRAGIDLPAGWEPFAIVLRASVPAIIVKMEVS